MRNSPNGRPCVVYLPGLDGTGRLLHRQADLHEQYDVRCIAYPQDQPQTYESLANLALSHLEGAGGGIVLAESFGGAVALTLALQRPDLVQRLVLVNTFAYFPRRLIVEPESGPAYARRLQAAISQSRRRLAHVLRRLAGSTKFTALFEEVVMLPQA